MCAEKIKIEARICKHCRNEFSEGDIEIERNNAIKNKSTGDLYEEFTNEDPISEEAILKELGDSNHSPVNESSEIHEAEALFEEAESIALDDSDEDIENKIELYNNVKDEIFTELKSTIANSNELSILASLYNQDYAKLIEMIAHPEDLTEEGAHVVSFLKRAH